MRDMAKWIAAREHNTSVSQLRSTERQPIYIALYQCHLPRLDDYGIIEYNQEHVLPLLKQPRPDRSPRSDTSVFDELNLDRYLSIRVRDDPLFKLIR
jgi:hypothetical protein